MVDGSLAESVAAAFDASSPRQGWLRDLPSEQPDWESNLMNIMSEYIETMLACCGQREIILNVWSDCAGLLTEGFAGKRIWDKLREHVSIDVKFKFFVVCEKEQRLRNFVRANFQPTHLSKDMSERDWDKNVPVR